MKGQIDFTEGKIVSPLLRFALPVLLALFLQAMYGAVDLLIVGNFAFSADVSAVATGSQLMLTITNLITSFSMGTTIFLGQKIGEKRASEGGKIVGNSLLFFLFLGIGLTIVLSVCAGPLSSLLNAPEEAFSKTVQYIRICGAGTLIITAYNLIGSIFRGLGDSRTPLITVAIACVCNIAGDLVLVSVFNMGAAGAAIATVGAQLISVLISFFLIKKKELPFSLERSSFRPDKAIIKKVVSLGAPIAIQDFLVGLSFLIILGIVNDLGLTYSAAMGVAEKVCMFIMLVPVAFMQSMAAFAAQNRGAGKPERAEKGLKYAIVVSLLFAVVLFFATFFRGDVMALIFTNDNGVILAAADYLKAYAIDCILVSFVFCFTGFFNGMERTRFVMAQSLAGAFCVRVPVSFLMSRIVPVSMFYIGLATPISSVLQIALCLIYLAVYKRQMQSAS